MVTMATELFRVTPDPVKHLKCNMNVLKESMNMQKGIFSGAVVDKRQLPLWMTQTVTLACSTILFLHRVSSTNNNLKNLSPRGLGK